MTPCHQQRLRQETEERNTKRKQESNFAYLFGVFEPDWASWATVERTAVQDDAVALVPDESDYGDSVGEDDEASGEESVDFEEEEEESEEEDEEEDEDEEEEGEKSRSSATPPPSIMGIEMIHRAFHDEKLAKRLTAHLEKALKSSQEELDVLTKNLNQLRAQLKERMRAACQARGCARPKSSRAQASETSKQLD